MAEVFGRSWLMIGFESELPEAGSYLAVTIGQNSVLLVRGRDGVIRGFPQHLPPSRLAAL